MLHLISRFVFITGVSVFSELSNLIIYKSLGRFDHLIAIREKTDGIIIKVWVQPRSSRNMIAGVHGDALKLKLTSPPVDGAANAACIEYFAKFLKISKSDVEIVAGHTGRSKRILCRGDKETLKNMIYSVSS